MMNTIPNSAMNGNVLVRISARRRVVTLHLAPTAWWIIT